MPLYARKLCLAWLLNFAGQASWAELVHRGDPSDQKTKKGTFIRVEKLSLWESTVQIGDVVGTPIGEEYDIFMTFSVIGFFILTFNSFIF